MLQDVTSLWRENASHKKQQWIWLTKVWYTLFFVINFNRNIFIFLSRGSELILLIEAMLIYRQSSHYTDIVCVCVCVFIDLPYIRCTSSGSTESRLLTRSLANASLQHSPLYVHEETANNGISLEHTLNSNTIHAALSDGFAATDRSWFKHNGWLLHQHGILLRKCNDLYLCINLNVKCGFHALKYGRCCFRALI